MIVMVLVAAAMEEATLRRPGELVDERMFLYLLGDNFLRGVLVVNEKIRTHLTFGPKKMVI